MQQQLIDLQPLLVETSDKTEKLMIKIEQDTVVVEKQKEVTTHEIKVFYPTLKRRGVYEVASRVFFLFVSANC